MELLYKGYDLENKTLFTGYTLASIAASFSKDEVLAIKIMPFTGLQDWRGYNIYEGDILSYWYPKTDKTFIGKVVYEPQLGRFIVLNKRYIDINESGMSGGVGLLKLDNAELVGNVFQSAFLLNKEPNPERSATTDDAILMNDDNKINSVKEGERLYSKEDMIGFADWIVENRYTNTADYQKKWFQWGDWEETIYTTEQLFNLYTQSPEFKNNQI